ncbi:ABC transporter permease [Sinosporangium siamense]|uniref:ABC transporter permease n=1 Tax=Sinosporangium siamense TaxID=1367973 RepID=A0A919RFH2_9ACTN|nr:ABC transporter permease [Sinosporangium siamense]GII91835.1 ABC transporter permease [Sinosporangium siamense]
MTALRRAHGLLGTPGLIGAAILTAVVGVAVYGFLLPEGAGHARVGTPYAPPGPGLPLGADDLGRDLFEQLVVGAGTSLSLGFLVAVATTVIAAVVGGAAGIGPRWMSATIMRGIDIMLILPELILFILAAAFLGQAFGIRVAILALILWPVPARVLRAAVLTAWSRGHLEVARAMGAPRWWLLVRHGSYLIGPLLIPVFVRTAMRAILYDATLSFLGLGDPTTPSWGTTLYWVQSNGVFLSEAWLWWALPPGAAITLTVLGLALIGIAVEERLNPALKEANSS